MYRIWAPRYLPRSQGSHGGDFLALRFNESAPLPPRSTKAKRHAVTTINQSVLAESPAMLDPISGWAIGITALMLSIYGPYTYWISHGPTWDKWREREEAADRRRLRQALRVENHAADAATLRQLTDPAAEIKARKDMQVEEDTDGKVKKKTV
ncbi:hypothetical protein LX36DRAFT_744889 [Colletotrichum falcatum]|nr:hypothetical protein LX36DRAFT_744889 [Colletotrichum falcatum]